MDDTREAALASRAVDEMTDAMTKLDQEIDAATKEIASKQEERKNTNTELEEANKLRGKEQGEFRTSQQEDQEAAKTVDNAKNVLANFYKDNGLVFLQAPAVEAGEAPPPPPATFKGDYGGKTGESQGIVAILEMVYDDIKKDQKKAKADEEESQAAFDKFEKSSNDEVGDIGAAISKAKGLIG